MAPKKAATATPKALASTKVEPLKVPETPNVYRLDQGEALPPQTPPNTAK